MFVYLIKNIIDNKAYVGISCDPDRRWYEHCKPCNRWNSYISNAINKHGRKNFDLICLGDYELLNEAQQIEKFWIEFLNTMSPNGYNLREGGEAGGTPSLETRQKISKARKGKPRGPISLETRIKIGNVHRGKKLSSEQIEGIRTRAKIRFSNPKNNPMFGKKHSPETKEKIRQRALQRNGKTTIKYC